MNVSAAAAKTIQYALRALVKVFFSRQMFLAFSSDYFSNYTLVDERV